MLAIKQLEYWLFLLRVPGIGCRTYLKILQSYQPEQLFSLSHSQLLALGIREKSISFIKTPDWTLIEPDLAWLKQQGNSVLTISEALYPPQLKEIEDPPPLLFITGDISLLSQPQIAIVGSRNPSGSGTQTAIEFAKALAHSGFVITSGLALGIDAVSHQGALIATGYTIAVAGTGLDRVYPARNKDLAMDIAKTGALISEFPIGTVAKANHFPRRNRIISGLCIGLLVVEAAKRSGSLITARMALEANREVFAIPGSIHNPLARGCNALIKEGAKLVEETEDIFNELGEYNQRPEENNSHALQTTLDLEQQNLLNLIMFSPTSVDNLVQESGYSVEAISSMLLMFELQGSIESVPGGYIRVK